MQRCRETWALMAGLAILLAGQGARGAPARPAIEVENLRVGFAGSQNNMYQVGAWTPVWVQLRAGSERFVGYMEVTVPDDHGTPTSIRQAVDVAAGESQRVTAYARPGSSEPEFLIQLYDRRGRRRARVAGSSVAQLDAIGPEQSMLLTLGHPQGVEMIPSLPGFSAAKNSPGHEVTVARIDAALGASMPGRWYGYDAARAIVVDTNDAEVMAALPIRGRALLEWVRRGGHLVVAVGANWQQIHDSVLGPILPAVPGPPERVGDLNVIESWSGSNKPITPPDAPPVWITKLDGIEGRGGKVLLGASGSVPLVVRGACGFGRVTVVALDVDQKPFATWPDRGLFWVRALDLRRQGGELDVQVTGGAGRFYQSGVTDLSTLLRQALEQFAEVKLVSFGWVAFFVFLYILLIGPGDYLFLKKVVKRMELTWVTFPLIVVTVSVLAYVAAYMIKGHQLLVNKVDIVDVDVPSGLVRGSTYFDVFSPENRDYDVRVIPLPLDRDLPADSETPARPPAGTEVMLGWLGVPEAGFGGMGGGSRMGFASGGYSYQPIGAAESLEGVRVPIWDTKCMTAQWFGPAPSRPIESDLQPAGVDRLAGTVTNHLAVPLEDALLAFNKQVYILGTIAPGQTVRVELKNDRILSSYLKEQLPKYYPGPGQPYQSPDSRISRLDLMLALMFHDSTTTSTAEAPLASNALHRLDLTGQLALGRPMLMARVGRPASRLVLDGASSPPKVDQTTLLRLILPLPKAEGESR